MGDLLPLDFGESEDPDDGPQVLVACLLVRGEEVEDGVLEEAQGGLRLRARHGHCVVALVALDRLPLGQFRLRAHQLVTQFRFRGVDAAAPFALEFQLSVERK